MKKRKSVSMIMEGCVSELSERIKRKQNENSTQLIELDESTYNIISYILSKSTRSKEDIYIVQVFLNSIPRKKSSVFKLPISFSTLPSPL